MVAWRGVADGNAHPELLEELKADFTTLGNGIIFDIADRCMNLIYMIPGNRINWLWSVTLFLSDLCMLSLFVESYIFAHAGHACICGPECICQCLFCGVAKSCIMVAE